MDAFFFYKSIDPKTILWRCNTKYLLNHDAGPWCYALWNTYITDNVVCECRNVINNVLRVFAWRSVVMSHYPSNTVHDGIVSVGSGDGFNDADFFKTKMQINVFNLDMGMFDVLEFSFKYYFFLHSLYNLTNLNMFQETIWHQQGSMS